MILLTVLRRLGCVSEDSKDDVAALYKTLKDADDAKPIGKRMGEESIERIVFNKTGLSFFNKTGLSFKSILADPDHIAKNLNYYIAECSSRARNILEKFKFEEKIEDLDKFNLLYFARSCLQILWRYYFFREQVRKSQMWPHGVFIVTERKS